MAMYHEKFAFFPDDLNYEEADWYEVYLVSDTLEKVESSQNVEGNPKSVSKSDYKISDPFGGELIKHRIEDPDITYKGRIYQFLEK
jgi:hypothetical protein